MSGIVLALLMQLSAATLLALLVFIAGFWFEPPYHDWLLLGLQSFIALAFSRLAKMAPWWLWIQFAFPIGLYALLSSDFNPWWGLVVAGLILLLFRNAVREQVPLYLSNATTRRALALLARQQDLRRFIDLGCGFGENVRFMSRTGLIEKAQGVETAPLVFWIAAWRSRGTLAEIAGTDLWQVNLAEYDLVYAFLSPKPMARLWGKVRREMVSGWFVSNSFPVPGIEPDDIWVLNDRRQTHLYLYRIEAEQPVVEEYSSSGDQPV
ncbi:hypothetical protein [Thiomicrorhabdus sp.]|uniref:hypothetical protein n=1 Tax=Thiomicrorhabdus sp. TaxID=2039724 RepID=UPI0029C91079|nr:hypothetical protein [Thiomicrorhabdus sp.]